MTDILPIVIEEAETALPAHVVDVANDYQKEGRAARTRRAYPTG